MAKSEQSNLFSIVVSSETLRAYSVWMLAGIRANGKATPMPVEKTQD